MKNSKFDTRPRWIRHRRIRVSVRGIAARPRLSVFRSNKQIYAQVIDDQVGRTLAAASSRDAGVAGSGDGKTDAATAVGTAIAKRAMEAGIKQVVFDRGGYKYHGRVKALADAARSEGLSF